MRYHVSDIAFIRWARKKCPGAKSAQESAITGRGMVFFAGRRRYFSAR